MKKADIGNPFAPPGEDLLYNPEFWRYFMRDFKNADLGALAERTGQPAGRIFDRLTAFLRGREAELSHKIHPGTDLIQ
jgi:hypothetical protein